MHLFASQIQVYRAGRPLWTRSICRWAVAAAAPVKKFKVQSLNLHVSATLYFVLNLFCTRPVYILFADNDCTHYNIKTFRKLPIYCANSVPLTTTCALLRAEPSSTVWHDCEHLPYHHNSLIHYACYELLSS